MFERMWKMLTNPYALRVPSPAALVIQNNSKGVEDPFAATISMRLARGEMRIYGTDYQRYESASAERREAYRTALALDFAHNLNLSEKFVRVTDVRPPGTTVGLEIELAEQQSYQGLSEILADKVQTGTFILRASRSSYERDLGGSPYHMVVEGAAILGGVSGGTYSLPSQSAQPFLPTPVRASISSQTNTVSLLASPPPRPSGSPFKPAAYGLAKQQRREAWTPFSSGNDIATKYTNTPRPMWQSQRAPPPWKIMPPSGIQVSPPPILIRRPFSPYADATVPEALFDPVLDPEAPKRAMHVNDVMTTLRTMFRAEGSRRVRSEQQQQQQQQQGPLQQSPSPCIPWTWVPGDRNDGRASVGARPWSHEGNASVQPPNLNPSRFSPLESLIQTDSPRSARMRRSPERSLHELNHGVVDVLNSASPYYPRQWKT